MAFLKTKDYFIPERQVLFEVISAVIFVIVNGYVTIKEMINRREGENQSTQNNQKANGILTAMKRVSVFVIFGGLIQSMTVMLGYVNGLCCLFGPITDLDHNGSIIVIVYQGMFMALYQLFHLWYTNNKIPREVSKLRYPLSLLMSVGSLGIIIALLTTVWNFNYRIKCGLTGSGAFTTTVVKWTSTFHTHGIGVTLYYSFMFSLLLYPLWEFFTLFLLIFKLRSIITNYVYVDCPGGQRLNLRVNLDDSLDYMKKQIFESDEKFPEKEQKLRFKGNILPDDKATLKSIGVGYGDSMQMSCGKMKIFVTDNCGNEVGVLVDPFDSIDALTAELQRKGLKTANEQRVFKTKQHGELINEILGGRPLRDYGLKEWDTIFLGGVTAPRTSSGDVAYPIFVECLDGEMLSLNVTNNIDIGKTKLQIERLTNNKYPANDQILKHQSRELDDDDAKLSDLGISKNAALQMLNWQDAMVHNGIRRLILLTVFYLVMMFIMGFIIWVIFSDIGPRGLYDSDDGIVYAKVLGSLFVSTTYSVSMWFMQPHNDSEYLMFLRILTYLRLHFCCCRCPEFVLQQKYHFARKIAKESRTRADPTELSRTGRNEGSLDNVPNEIALVTSHSMASVVVPVLEPEDDVDIGPEEEIKDEYDSGQECQDASEEKTEEEQLNKMVNDFLFVNSTNEFSFGVYLEYWRENTKNYVKPQYSDLKDELTHNVYNKLSRKQYDRLLAECREILQKETLFAKEIGRYNEICDIWPGTPMTIHHMMAIKVYTDFDNVQREFKRHCRRLYKGEPVKRVMVRNSEIAHWCRLLAECVMFYGDTMSRTKTLYSGINAPLVFKSLLQHFECPLSTTIDEAIAHRFSGDGKGMIMRLQRANPKTRYLDVSKFSCFGDQEKERLIKGSSVEIVDIYYNQTWLRHSLMAIRMFEQIIRGMFIDDNKKARITLLSLILRMMDKTVIEQLPQRKFLEAEAYDTETMLQDLELVEDENSSNITGTFGDDVKHEIMDDLDRIRKHQLVQLYLGRKARKKLMDIESDDTAKYVWSLFKSILDEMKVKEQNMTPWINQDELNREEFADIKEALFGEGKLFDYIGIKKDEIPIVHQESWLINGDEYDNLKDLAVAEYIKSPYFVHSMESDCDITFRLRCYCKYSEDSQQCAIYLEIQEFPESVTKLRIEADIKGILRNECDGEEKTVTEYRQLLKTQTFTRKKNVRGFQLFEHDELMENTSLEWMIGVKILRAEQSKHDEQEQYLEDLYQLL